LGENPPQKTLPKIFDLQEIRAEVEARRDDKREPLEQLLDGTLRVPPGNRETLLHPVLSALAWMRHAPTEGVVEVLLRRIFEVREGHELHLEEWVRKATDSYARGLEKKAAADAGVAVVEKFFRDESWREKLQFKTDSKGGVTGLKPTESNVLSVIENDPAFAGHIKWNVLRHSLEIKGGVLEGEPAESLDVPTAAWFQRSEYRCEASREVVGACLQHYALSHSYDPVREFLEALPAWDGKPRLNDMLLKYAKAEGSPEWVRIITRKFFISAVARALSPGCQVDTVLVLQGAQGGGKTSLVRVMGAGFHVETNLDLHSKDAVQVSSSAWLVELGELASLKKSDVESTRNFLTRKEDAIRLPYGRVVVKLPRRCVFMGTTNSKQPLSDPEGNRRFWVVSVRTVDTTGLALVRDQLWAEAMHAYKSGEQWWLTQDEAARAVTEASVYEAEDITKIEILRWLEDQKKWPQYLHAAEVLTRIMHKAPGTITHMEVAAANRTMSSLGWERTRRRVAGVAVYCYRLPDRAKYLRELDMAEAGNIDIAET